MGAVSKEMGNHKTSIWRGRTEIHREQAIVERFNRSLAERLFGHKYSVDCTGQRSTAWGRRLPEVVSALNNDATRLTGKKTAYADVLAAKPSTPYLRPVGVNEKKLPTFVNGRWRQTRHRSNLIFEGLCT